VAAVSRPSRHKVACDRYVELQKKITDGFGSV
jgi:hypothetical protein